MNRLGDVRACSLGGEGTTPWEQGELSLDDPGVFAALMAGRNASLGVVIRLQDSAERLILNVELVEAGQPPRWSGRV